ncbi:MAG: helix-turn-helix transcriptional regulator [Clostridia bacterium]|nr:helix-turn-helix transcriptional regulator [Clostridia bacterium]
MTDLNEKKEIARFQRNLETLRRIAGWSTDDLAEKIGVTKQTVRNLELAVKAGGNGKPAMSKLQYIGIRSAFQVESETNDLLAKAMPILLNPNESDEEAAETSEKVQTITAAKAGGASTAAVTKLLLALFPLGIVGVAAAPAVATWLKELFKEKK